MTRRRFLVVATSIAIVAAVATFAVAMDARPVDACFVQVNPAPHPGLVSGTGCRWYTRDGTPYDELFRGGGVGVPWYILIPVAMMLMYIPLLSRAQLAGILEAARGPLRYFTPGADLRRD